jgi:hypothetical protein
MNISIKIGTKVIAIIEEKPTDNVLVHARGRNIRTSCASRRNTGRKETTMIREKKRWPGRPVWRP